MLKRQPRANLLTEIPPKRRSGQSLVEFALILPVMLILLLTALDLARLLYSQITVTNAAKEGAIVASQGGTFQANQGCSDANTVMCGVLTEAKGGFVEVDQTRVTLAPSVCVKNAMYPATGAPPDVAITVKAPFKVITPIIGAFLASNVILTGTAEAQCLVVPDTTFPSLPAPVARIVTSPNPPSGTAPLTVSFDPSTSSAPGATIVSYTWSGGPTTPGPALQTRTYNSSGTFVVTLTVTDNFGNTGTTSVSVSVAPVVCAVVTPSFTATPNANGGHPHRVTLNGLVSPSSSGWTWGWTSGALTASGQSTNIDFPTAGSQSVTLTVTKASCSYVVTQTVTAP